MDKYLIIDEDRSVYRTSELTPDLLEYANGNYCSIIDITTMTEYMNGTWIHLMSWPIKEEDSDD